MYGISETGLDLTRFDGFFVDDEDERLEVDVDGSDSG